MVVLTVFGGQHRPVLVELHPIQRAEARPRGHHAVPAVVSRGLAARRCWSFTSSSYPMMILSLTDGGGALKWIDNFGISDAHST